MLKVSKILTATLNAAFIDPQGKLWKAGAEHEFEHYNLAKDLVKRLKLEDSGGAFTNLMQRGWIRINAYGTYVGAQCLNWTDPRLHALQLAIMKNPAYQRKTICLETGNKVLYEGSERELIEVNSINDLSRLMRYNRHPQVQSEQEQQNSQEQYYEDQLLEGDFATSDRNFAQGWDKTAASEGLKKDLMAVRPFLRDWVGGGWDDRDRNARLALKHEKTLAKFKPNQALRLWRNERMEGPNGLGGLNNHGWEDQYKYPTAWTTDRYSAESYARGPGRKLVTAIVPPEDMLVSIPEIDAAARSLGWAGFDKLRQSEIVVKAHPSFLEQKREPVKYSREEEQQIREALRKKVEAFYAPQVARMQAEKPEMKNTLAQRADERIRGMVDGIPSEELPERVKEWEEKLKGWVNA